MIVIAESGFAESLVPLFEESTSPMNSVPHYRVLVALEPIIWTCIFPQLLFSMSQVLLLIVYF